MHCQRWGSVYHLHGRHRLWDTWLEILLATCAQCLLRMRAIVTPIHNNNRLVTLCSLTVGGEIMPQFVYIYIYILYLTNTAATWRKCANFAALSFEWFRSGVTLLLFCCVSARYQAAKPKKKTNNRQNQKKSGSVGFHCVCWASRRQLPSVFAAV